MLDFRSQLSHRLGMERLELGFCRSLCSFFSVILITVFLRSFDNHDFTSVVSVSSVVLFLCFFRFFNHRFHGWTQIQKDKDPCGLSFVSSVSFVASSSVSSDLNHGFHGWTQIQKDKDPCGAFRGDGGDFGEWFLKLRLRGVRGGAGLGWWVCWQKKTFVMDGNPLFYVVFWSNY